ncbi:helix-turn-helix domain-containing protein [Streptomyces thermovulgaris]
MAGVSVQGVAVLLRVTPRSVCRWRRAWAAGGPAATRSSARR